MFAPRQRRHYNSSDSENQTTNTHMQNNVLKAVVIVALALGAFGLGACQNRSTATTSAPASTYSK